MPEPIPAKVLIVDDDTDVLLAAKLLLKRHFRQVDVEKNPERLPFLVSNGNYDLILLDMNFSRDVSSGKEGFAWLDRILDINPQVPVVLLTAYGDVEMAVRAIKLGAADFVLKPWENEKLLATLQTALAGKMKKVDGKKGSTHSVTQAVLPSLIGQSPAMRSVFDTIERVAGTEANVLILGENGTGKDLVARAIHQQSHRKAGPFVSVDLGALSENLLESELFGHVKGAFTDAREDRVGRFEEARGGTIFLDEIGNMTLPQQARLLTVLQQRQVTRVGSNQARLVDVRLVCATNVPIHERVAERQFRQDLLYRINTIEIRLPPLRERPEDLEVLAQHFLERYRAQYQRPLTGLSPALIRHLRQYAWPGNVRELQHAIERAVIMAQPRTASGALLEPADLPLHTPAAGPSPLAETMQLDEVEKALIQRAMNQYQGNITEVARELGLSRQALYRRLEKHGL
jgi:two-component system response regulator HydG